MIDRYKNDRVREIWKDENKYRIWWTVEAAYMRSIDVIDSGELNELVNHYDRTSLQICGDIAIEEATTHHDVAAFVNVMEAASSKVIGDKSRYVHYGLTSSDIVDTSLSIMLKQSVDVLLDMVGGLSCSMHDRFDSIGKTLIMARTHGQIAEPIRISDKIKFWLNPLTYIADAIKDVEVQYKISGSVGVYRYNAHVSQQTFVDGLQTYIPMLNAKFSSSLTVGQIISRIYYYDIVSLISTISMAVDNIAMDIRLYSQDGIGLMREGFGRGQIGSSSMPHKKNPIGCENICGISKVIRGHVQAIASSASLWNERDISHSSVERIAIPDVIELTAYQIVKLSSIISDLSIDTEAILKECNDNSSKGMSQAKMLGLIDDGLTRAAAHERIAGNG